MCQCALCGKEIDVDEQSIMYDGDECHLKCAREDQDSIGMDCEFGD